MIPTVVGASVEDEGKVVTFRASVLFADDCVVFICGVDIVAFTVIFIPELFNDTSVSLEDDEVFVVFTSEGGTVVFTGGGVNVAFKDGVGEVVFTGEGGTVAFVGGGGNVEFEDGVGKVVFGKVTFIGGGGNVEFNDGIGKVLFTGEGGAVAFTGGGGMVALIGVSVALAGTVALIVTGTVGASVDV